MMAEHGRHQRTLKLRRGTIIFSPADTRPIVEALTHLGEAPAPDRFPRLQRRQRVTDAHTVPGHNYPSVIDIALIRKRDGDRCARCGATSPLHVHHRIRRGQGGGNHSSNLITLCASCHKWVHDHPYAALEHGYLLKPGSVPELEEIRHMMWPAGPVWLDNQLGFALTPPDGAASPHPVTASPV